MWAVPGKSTVFCGLDPLTVAPRINQLYSNRNDVGEGLYCAHWCSFQDLRCPLLVNERLTAAHTKVDFIVLRYRAGISIKAQEWDDCLLCNYIFVKLHCESNAHEQYVWTFSDYSQENAHCRIKTTKLKFNLDLSCVWDLYYLFLSAA